MILATLTVFASDQKSDNQGYYETEKKDSVKINLVDKVNNTATTITEKIEVNSIEYEKDKEKESDNEKNEVVLNQKMLDHSVFDALLRAHVDSEGKVDYRAIKGKIAVLDGYLGYLSQNVPKVSTSKNESLAFWINAYNANTIKLIVDNYPTKSIMDLYSGKAFDNKWINIGGEKLSLNDIENNKIRSKYNEPRIHFAVNCAAKSCPPILNKAWTAASVQSNLDNRTRAFINDSTFNKLSSNTIEISKIFEWYASDFPKSIVSFLNQYSNTKIDSNAKVSYIEYDWALNAK